MQAISSPIPDPIRFTPLPTESEEQGDGRRRWRAWAVPIAIALVAFGLGRGTAGTEVLEVAPDLDSTLDWMFDAALAHPAATVDGVSAPAELQEVAIEEVQIVDPGSGPIMAIVSHTEGLAAYEVVVERLGMDWTVRARHLGSG